MTAMIQTDNTAYDAAVGDKVHAAVIDTFGSVNGGAKASGIAYATLDRKIKGHTSFTVSELRRLGIATGRATNSFLPAEERAA